MQSRDTVIDKNGRKPVKTVCVCVYFLVSAVSKKK